MEMLSTARLSGRQRSDGKVVQTRFEQVLIFAGVAQLVEQRIRNQDSDALTTEAEAKHGKAFGPPAV
jgi:hypothetical protein